MATGLERLNVGILRHVNAPSSCKFGIVEQTPHETGLLNLSTYQNELQVFPKYPTSNFYSAVCISRANFVVPKKFSDISSVEMTNRKQNLLWFVPNTHKTLIGWSSLQTRHHRLKLLLILLILPSLLPPHFCRESFVNFMIVIVRWKRMELHKDTETMTHGSTNLMAQ